MNAPLPLVRRVDAPQFMDIGGKMHATHEGAAEASVHALVLESVRKGYQTWTTNGLPGHWDTVVADQLAADFIVARKPPVR